jgi:hypothetical protein
LADSTADGPGTSPPAAENPPPAPVEQDSLFRLQMAISDFVLGNAKYAGTLVGIILLGALIYGLTTSWLASREANEFAEVARIDFKMPKVEQMALYGLAPMDDKSDTARMATVEEGAKRYAAAGDASHGAAAVYAFLKSADAWERVGNTDEKLAVLAKANAVGASDLAGYTAGAAYASALLDAGKTDDGLQTLQGMTTRFKGFYAERSFLLLAEAQVAAGKAAEARATIEAFSKQFQDSPRAAEIAAIAQKLGNGG